MCIKWCALSFIIFSGFVLQGVASAADPAGYGSCTPVGGIHIFTFNNAQSSITDVAKNAAGTILSDIYHFDLNGSYKTTGCGYNGVAYITSTSDLPVISDNSDGGKWYVLNDYLGVSLQGWVAGNTNKYFPVPFISVSNTLATSDQGYWGSGSKGKVSILIRRPFIGFSHFSEIVMYTQISKNPNTGNSGPYVSELTMNGQIDVPQSCELDTGTTITMDFGNIGAPLFSQAGAGNKPAGVNPKTHTIAIKCKNIDAQALLSMRLESNNASGNAMVSDNKDVGFVLADSSRNPLTPNNIDSKIKFQLDDNSAATVPITAWPISITGNKPAEGKFTAEGYLRIDFD